MPVHSKFKVINVEHINNDKEEKDVFKMIFRDPSSYSDNWTLCLNTLARNMDGLDSIWYKQPHSA